MPSTGHSRRRPKSSPRPTAKPAPKPDRRFARPRWERYFLEVCRAIALRAIDEDTQNGAVITTAKHRFVSAGYNGFPAGVDDGFWPNQRGQSVQIPKVRVPRGADPYKTEYHQPLLTTKQMRELAVYHPMLTAKMQGYQDSFPFYEHYDVDKYMVIEHAESNAIVAAGQDLHGCTLYTHLFPCHNCAKLAITAGITKVVFALTREDISWAVAKELFIQAGVQLVPYDEARMFRCSHELPCCKRHGEYNGYGSGGRLRFRCPKSCPCHD